MLDGLLSNAYLYVLPSEIEGLSTELLEALGYGNCVLVSDIEENLEVIEDAGVTFRSRSAEDLGLKLCFLLQNPDLAKNYRNQARHIIVERYDWEGVTEQYEALYQTLLTRKE